MPVLLTGMSHAGQEFRGFEGRYDSFSGQNVQDGMIRFYDLSPRGDCRRGETVMGVEWFEKKSAPRCWSDSGFMDEVFAF
mmetsp:Transcript_8583/g.21347  ORF Transcript_8583/g.21347 Transcript_8583/m.21347 type:complete len:80 (+) Transcript_8583:1368-1607(+)